MFSSFDEADNHPQLKEDLKKANQPHCVKIVLTGSFQPEGKPDPHKNGKHVLQCVAESHSISFLNEDEAFREDQNKCSEYPHVVLHSDNFVEGNEG